MRSASICLASDSKVAGRPRLALPIAILGFLDEKQPFAMGSSAQSMESACSFKEHYGSTICKDVFRACSNDAQGFIHNALQFITRRREDSWLGCFASPRLWTNNWWANLEVVSFNQAPARQLHSGEVAHLVSFNERRVPASLRTAGFLKQAGASENCKLT